MPTDPIVSQGEFHASVPPSRPIEADKHAPGTRVGNDAAPEFHASTQPRAQDTWVDAESTITGATSQDVYKGLGKPVQGQTAGDLRHHTSQRSGLEGVGTSAEDSILKRGLERDVPKGGKTRDDMPAEERATMLGVGDR
ncbi:hypothetical protein V501_08357 [Pseudogymnoascus sp. VKM F-4519 (FW-2642)]|nr:hypothetical protein V501_08357 [Pseudogymnoascus sp. VKM F-4519 (FW-2642)]